MKFVDPKNDVAFKKIFADENKKEILISFLNNLLDFSGTPKEIVEISIANPYQTPKLKDLKETILDIRALDKRGIHYIIEMQVFHTTALEKRILYYASKAYYLQLNKGDDYPKLNQVIFLGFLDFNLFKESTHYLTHHLILEVNTGENYLQDFQFHFVELPKFVKTLEELDDVKEKWIYFVKNAGNMEMIPNKLQEPVEIREAFDVANRMNWTTEELEDYEKRGIFIQDQRGWAEQARIEGIEEGMEKGRIEGKREGAEEERLKIAAQMKKKGFDLSTISQITHIAQEEIDKL